MTSYYQLSVKIYLRTLEKYLAQAVESEDITIGQANSWAVGALKALGYTSQADYAARGTADTRILNPAHGADVAQMPIGFSPAQLPFYNAILTQAEYVPRMAEFQQLRAQEQWEKEKSLRQEKAREEAWAEQERHLPGGRPQPPTGEEAIREFLGEERPHGLQGFMEAELPSVLGEVQREMTGARRAWWQAIQRPTYEEALAEAEFEAGRWGTVKEKGIEAGLTRKLLQLEVELGRPLQPTDVMPSEWAFHISGKKRLEYATEARGLRGYTPKQIGQYDAGREAEDPLKAYLAQYPWSSEFMKLSPSQRGFYPSRYAPSARWFV